MASGMPNRQVNMRNDGRIFVIGIGVGIEERQQGVANFATQ
jgi:hypothetical protein